MKKLTIGSVRLGHANNSSSSHSILLNCTWTGGVSPAGDFRYGWEGFLIPGEDHDGKARYLGALLFSSFCGDGMADEHAKIIAEQLTGCGPMDRDAYVDHQSVFVFPAQYGTNHYDNRFIEEFVGYIRDNPSISIAGGNDNGGSVEEMGCDGERHALNDLPQEVWGIHKKLHCRRDGGWWILYNRETGAKIRLAFADDPGKYTRATTPELVDVKITDYCPHGCKFCYQSSTEKGQHAGMELIDHLVWTMRDAQVFEVALGGGETTMHPKFVDILQKFSDALITPNFTTFNMDWAKDHKIAKAVRKYAGSFAVSTMTPEVIDRMAQWNNRMENPDGGARAVLQIPLGCYDQDEIVRALKHAKTKNVDVTLLGFKDHGRGKGFAVKDYTWIVDYLLDQANGWWRFGADTVFVEQFGARFQQEGVDPRLMVGQEGQFSCYIDAVSKRMGASSYTTALHPLPSDAPFGQFPYA